MKETDVSGTDGALPIPEPLALPSSTFGEPLSCQDLKSRRFFHSLTRSKHNRAKTRTRRFNDLTRAIPSVFHSVPAGTLRRKAYS